MADPGKWDPLFEALPSATLHRVAVTPAKSCRRTGDKTAGRHEKTGRRAFAQPGQADALRLIIVGLHMSYR
jgi:hypothetical protein